MYVFVRGWNTFNFKQGYSKIDSFISFKMNKGGQWSYWWVYSFYCIFVLWILDAMANLMKQCQAKFRFLNFRQHKLLIVHNYVTGLYLTMLHGIMRLNSCSLAWMRTTKQQATHEHNHQYKGGCNIMHWFWIGFIYKLRILKCWICVDERTKLLNVTG